MLCIRGISAQIDLAVTLTIFHLFFPRYMLKGVPKSTEHDFLDFLKKFLTKKTKNHTVGRKENKNHNK